MHAETHSATDDLRLFLELFQFCQKIVAVFAVDFDGKGFREIEAENSENGFGVDDVSVAAEIDIVGIFLNDGYESFYLTCHLKRNLNRFHK